MDTAEIIFLSKASIGVHSEPSAIPPNLNSAYKALNLNVTLPAVSAVIYTLDVQWPAAAS